MTRLRSVLACVVLSLPVVTASVRPVPRAYEEDVHFFFTYVLMRLVCFSHIEALQIASADQSIDDDFSTGPIVFNIGDNNAKWHAFGTPEEVNKRKQELWDRACKSKSFVEFGQYLHFQEDTHSHVDSEGKPYGPTVGHAKDFRQPDRVPNNKQRAREMAKEKLEDARKFMKKCLDREPADMVSDDIISGLVDAQSLAYRLAATGGYNEANVAQTPTDLQRMLDKWFAEGKITKQIKVPQKSEKIEYDFDGDGKVNNQGEVDEKVKTVSQYSYIDPKTIKNVRTYAPPYAIQGDTILVTTVVEFERPLNADESKKATDWAVESWDVGGEKVVSSVVVAPDSNAMVMRSTMELRRTGWAPIIYAVGSRIFKSPGQAAAVCTFAKESKPSNLQTIAPSVVAGGSVANIVGAIASVDTIVLESDTGKSIKDCQLLASSSCSAAVFVPPSIEPGSYRFGIRRANGNVDFASSKTEVYSPRYRIEPAMATPGQKITITATLDRDPSPEAMLVVQNLTSIMRLPQGDVATVAFRGREATLTGTAVAVGRVEVSLSLVDKSDAARRVPAAMAIRRLEERNLPARLHGPWQTKDMPPMPWRSRL